MSVARVVAFDGTPVKGGAGMRVAILEREPGSFVATNQRQLEAQELQQLRAGGYVTPISPPIETRRLDGVIVYRHRDFAFAGLSLEDDLVWCACEDIEVTYLEADAATSLLERHAKIALVGARAALAKFAVLSARECARRGLMVTPHLRSSNVGAQLYGLMLAAATMQGNPEPIRRELALMLDDIRCTIAVTAAANALARRVLPSLDTRRTERPITIGSSAAPREAA